ncbi:hypothetical protein BT69DRAFT_179829 [Atractiella rhizophila]|nr:hypothetical protein BT69DRAFT_179829 [Atractiella rhizophila]
MSSTRTALPGPSSLDEKDNLAPITEPQNSGPSSQPISRSPELSNPPGDHRFPSQFAARQTYGEGDYQQRMPPDSRYPVPYPSNIPPPPSNGFMPRPVDPTFDRPPNDRGFQRPPPPSGPPGPHGPPRRPDLEYQRRPSDPGFSPNPYDRPDLNFGASAPSVGPAPPQGGPRLPSIRALEDPYAAPRPESNVTDGRNGYFGGPAVPPPPHGHLPGAPSYGLPQAPYPGPQRGPNPPREIPVSQQSPMPPPSWDAPYSAAWNFQGGRRSPPPTTMSGPTDRFQGRPYDSAFDFGRREPWDPRYAAPFDSRMEFNRPAVPPMHGIDIPRGPTMEEWDSLRGTPGIPTAAYDARSYAPPKQHQPVYGYHGGRDAWSEPRERWEDSQFAFQPPPQHHFPPAGGPPPRMDLPPPSGIVGPPVARNERRY